MFKLKKQLRFSNGLEGSGYTVYEPGETSVGISYNLSPTRIDITFHLYDKEMNSIRYIPTGMLRVEKNKMLINEVTTEEEGAYEKYFKLINKGDLKWASELVFHDGVLPDYI